MNLFLDLDDEVVQIARDKCMAANISLEKAIEAYVTRVAEGAEPVENEFLPDGALKRRTLRQQIYRAGT